MLDLPGLRCLTASPEALLALKVLAHRVGEDEDDLRLLARELRLENAKQVLALAERTFGDRLDPAARFFVEQIFDPRLSGAAASACRVAQRSPDLLGGDHAAELAVGIDGEDSAEAA